MLLIVLFFLFTWRDASALPLAEVGDPTVQQHALWRAQIKRSLSIPDPPPPLNAVTHGRFEPAPGVVAERVTYGTQFGLRVPAILYLPGARTGRLPGLIVVNGHGGDKYSWYSFYSGILYARAGAAVLTFDPLGEGERNIERKSGTRAHDEMVFPREMGQRMGGQLVTDVLQAISYLAHRPEVNPNNIAVMGYSLGSFLVALAGAVDTRLRASVLVGGGNLDGPGEYWDKSKPMCQGIPYQSLMCLGDRAAVIYALHASRGPTLVFNGLADTVVAIPSHSEPFFQDLQRRTAELRGSPKGIFETRFVPDVSHRPFFVTRPVALWLERQLDFPNWAETDIISMPETHVSEWARAHGVEMDPRYSGEQREGGTRALGTAVPGLSRQGLDVFSRQEWERNKPKMVYESWIAAAKSEIAGGRSFDALWKIDNLKRAGKWKVTVLGNPSVIQTKRGNAVCFDGKDDGLFLDINPLAGAHEFTVEVVFRPDPGGEKEQRFLHFQANEAERVLIETRLVGNGEWFLDTFIKSGASERTLQSRTALHPLGEWYHAALVYDGQEMRHYVDSVQEMSGAVSYVPMDRGQTSIGCRLNRVFWFKGGIKSVRIRHRALSPQEFMRIEY